MQYCKINSPAEIIHRSFIPCCMTNHAEQFVQICRLFLSYDRHTHKLTRSVHRRSLVLAFGGGGGAMASTVARAYNEGLGAVPPAGSRGRAPGQGVWGSPPEAEHNYTFHEAIFAEF